MSEHIDEASSTSTPQPEEKPIWKRPRPEPILRSEAYHGLAGEVVRLLCTPQPPRKKPCTEADPAAVLFSLITAIGNIIGSDAKIEIDGAEHPPRLYTLIVGSTGKGRKGTAFTTISLLLKLIDIAWFKYCKKSGFASGEAIIAEYKEREDDENSVPVERDTDHERERRLKKRLFLKESEFSQFLGKSGRDGNILSEVIRVGWEESTLENRRAQEKVVATDVHISILANITPEELLRKLPAADLTNGFTNRFVMCFSRRPAKVSRPPKPNTQEIERIAEAMRDRIGRMRHAPIDLSEEAWALYDETYLARPESDGPLGALTVRAEVQCLRIAIIFAILDGTNIIESQHLKAAYAMWDYSEASFEYVFGDLMEDPAQDRIMEALIDVYPGGLTKDDLLRRTFSGHLKGGVTEPIEALRAEGRVRVESEPPRVQKGEGTARPVTRVFAVYPPPDSLKSLKTQDGVNSVDRTLKSLKSLKTQALHGGKMCNSAPAASIQDAPSREIIPRNGSTRPPSQGEIEAVTHDDDDSLIIE